MTQALKRVRTLSLAPSQSCYSPQGLAARSYVVNRLDTDLTTKLARWDDNRPTPSMTGTHAISNRRHRTLCVKRYFQFLPLASPHGTTSTLTLLNKTFTNLPKLRKRTETLHLLLQWLYLTLRAPLKPFHSISQILKPYNIRIVHKPKTILRHLLTNVN